MDNQPTERAHQLADNLMAKVARHCDAGKLPNCYGGPNRGWDEYLYDFYPDLPWEPGGTAAAIKHILARHQPTLDRVRAAFGFDLAARLRADLAECERCAAL